VTPDPALRGAFAALHRGPGPLLLPNAWDVASALALVADGHPAVGTTSLGLAASAGQPDGTRAARSATVALATRLAALPVPVTVDLEDGFADDPAEVAALVRGLPVAGVNLEDGAVGRLADAGRHAAKVAAVKDACPAVFVNARVDTYWLGEEAHLAATIARAERYVAAGADGIFVPGRLTEDEIAALAGAAPVPLNVLATADHAVSRLAELGVRRISTGSLLFRASLDAAVAAARVLRDGGRAPAATPYDEIDRRSAAHARSTGGS
jgi:2-methylisocitrate lyase-like PEP mutase family enzyme